MALDGFTIGGSDTAAPAAPSAAPAGGSTALKGFTIGASAAPSTAAPAATTAPSALKGFSLGTPAPQLDTSGSKIASNISSMTPSKPADTSSLFSGFAAKNNFTLPSTNTETSTPIVAGAKASQNLPDDSVALPKNPTDLINDAVIKTPAELLQQTPFIQQAASGIDAGSVAGNFGLNMVQKLAIGLKTITGVTGGIYEPPAGTQPSNPDLLDKGLNAITTGFGALLSIGGDVTTGAKGLSALGDTAVGVKTSQALTDLVGKYPLLAKYIGPYIRPLVENTAGFAAYSQLDPNLGLDLKARGEKLLEAIGTAPLYTALGAIQNPIFRLPASFALGFSSAKLSGASNEDAVTSGTVFAFLDAAATAVGERGNSPEAQEVANAKKNTTDALNVLQPYSKVKLTTNSSTDEFKAAFYKGIHQTHPDVGGTAEKFNAVKQAYDLLSKGAVSKIAPAPTEAEQSVKTLSGEVKDSIDKNGPMVTHQALVDNLDLDSAKADSIVKANMKPTTPAEIQASKDEGMAQIYAARSDADITAKSNEYVDKNIETLTDSYLKEHGNVVGADEAKELVPGYSHDRSASDLVQRAAGKIADNAYERLLNTKQGEKNNTVLITAGGTGAGKSTALNSGGYDAKQFPVVYDTNLSNAKGGIKRIQDALDKGYNVHLVYVSTPVREAYRRVLGRSEEMAQKRGSGRPVSAQGHIDMHHGSIDALPEILKHAFDNSKGGKLFTDILDNAGKNPILVDNNLDFINKLRDNKEDENELHTGLNEERAKAFSESRISEQTNKAFDRAEGLRPKKNNKLDAEKPKESSKLETGGPSKSVLNRGFVNPEQIAKDTAAAVQKVRDTLKEIENVRQLSGDIRDAGYQHENKRVANRQRLINLANDVGNMLDAQGWNDLYHYDENSDEKITPAEKAVYEGVIKPLKDTLASVITEYKKLGGQSDADLFFMNDEGYTPRFAVDKNSPLDKILKTGKDVTETLRNGGLLSKSLGTVDKSRVYRSLTDENGNRTVAAIKAKKVTQIVNGKGTDLGKLQMQSNSKVLASELAPVKNKITSLQRTVRILKSVKTSEPVSVQKLTNLKNRISDLKSIIKENESDPLVAIHASLNKDIDKISDDIDAFETKYKTLKPFEQKSPAVAKEVTKLETRLTDAYEKESNLSLSDVYEQVSGIAKNSNEISEKSQAALEKATTEFRALSKVKSADKVVLTSRRIATLEKKIVEASNAMAAIEAEYNPDKLDQRVFVGSDGKRYTLGQATTKEIEANTKTRYHTNVLANYLVALDRSTNALNAVRLLDRIKNEEEFGDIIRKDNPDEAAPDGWKTVGDILPQFRGYHLEPRAAEVLTDLANRQKGYTPILVFDQINNFLTSLIVFNPVMHIPNVVAGRSTAAAALGVPAKSLANLQTAFNEVKTAGPLYLSYLEHGAPFMALKGTTKNFSDAILNQYTDEIENEKDPTFLDEHQQLANILGYSNPVTMARGLSSLNEHLTWGSNDVLFMHALMDYNDVHGGTMEEAIAAVSKYMADYRIPERIGPGQFGRVVSQAMQSRAFMFGRFHYSGVIKPWLEAASDSAGPNSTGKERLQGMRSLAYMLLMGLLVWPYINKMWQGITGSPTSYESMPGPLRPIQVAEKAFQQGPAGVPTALNSIFTVAPVVRSMIELGFNTDLYTRNPIYGNLPAEGLSTYGVSTLSPLATASRMNPGDFALSLFGVWTPKNVPALTSLDAMKYDELPALQTQVKKDIAAGNQAKANAEMAEFNTRAITTWNQYELQTGSTDLVTTDAQKQTFLKEWGIKEPGAVALAHANTLYGDGSLTDKSSLIANISTYAKAFGISPVEAFHLIFSGQTIARVQNFGLFDPDSSIIVQRAPLSYTEPIKQQQETAQGKTNDNSTLELDHVIPLEAGGSNDEGNLNLITTAQNMGEQHTFENALGAAVKAGQITQKQVREYSIRYKVGQGETLPSAYMQEFETKYGGKTMTLQEVEDAIAGK